MLVAALIFFILEKTMEIQEYKYRHDMLRVEHPWCCGRAVEKSFPFYVCFECGKEVCGYGDFVTPDEDFKVVLDESSGHCSMPRCDFPLRIGQRDSTKNLKDCFEQYIGEYAHRKVTRKSPAELSKVSKRHLSQVDVCHPDAYAVVRKVLLGDRFNKKLRLYYPYIFELIYMNGGVKPPYSVTASYGRIADEFKVLATFFHERWKNPKCKSIPCAWMLVRLVLDYYNLNPYYRMPEVANVRSKSAVYDFWSAYKREVIDRRDNRYLWQFHRDHGIWTSDWSNVSHGLPPKKNWH